MENPGVGTDSNYQGVATDWFGWLDGWMDERIQM